MRFLFPRSRLLAGKLFREQRACERAPRESLVGDKRLKRGRGLGQLARRLPQQLKVFEERCPALRPVELLGERRNCSPVEDESSLGVTAGRKEKQRAPASAVQLVLLELEFLSGEER